MCNQPVLSRYSNEDLEEFKSSVLNDKLYFMAATSKRQRQKQMEKLPPFIKGSKPKVDIGCMSSLRDRKHLNDSSLERDNTDINYSFTAKPEAPMASQSPKAHKPRQPFQIQPQAKLRQTCQTQFNRSMPPRKKQAHSPSKQSTESVNMTNVEHQSQANLTQQSMTQKFLKKDNSEKLENLRTFSQSQVQVAKSTFLEKFSAPRIVFKEKSKKSISSFTDRLNQTMEKNDRIIQQNQFVLPMDRDNEQLPAVAPSASQSSNLHLIDQVFEEKFHKLMTETKREIRNSLRESTHCFRSGKQKGEALPAVVTVSKQKSEVFEMDSFVSTLVIIENIRGKPQPINIQLTGVRGELIAFLSLTHQQPSEANHQKMYAATSDIMFSTVPWEVLLKEHEQEALAAQGAFKESFAS